jgi:hypothetical protein
MSLTNLCRRGISADIVMFSSPVDWIGSFATPKVPEAGEFLRVRRSYFSVDTIELAIFRSV